MKKTIFLPLVLTFLLVGCNNTQTSSNENNSSNNENSSSITESSSETSSSETSSSQEASSSENFLATKAKINDAMGKLLSINGHAKKASIEQLEGSYYMTEGLPLSIIVKSSGEANHYVLNDQREFATLDTTHYFYDDGHDSYEEADKVHTELSYDNSYFYRITTHKDKDTEDTLEKFTFNKDNIDTFMDFGFGIIECLNLAQFATFTDVENAKAEIKGIDGFTKNGTWNLSYYLEIYEPGTKIVTQTITYNDTMTIQDGKIVKAYQQMENALYVGKDKANWKISETTFTYTHGDFTLYDGVVLNPSDFKEKN